MERTWISEYKDFSSRTIPDEEAEVLYRKYPRLSMSYEQGCPTCHGARRYVWRDEEHVCDCREQLSLHKFYLMANIGELYQRLDWSDFVGEPEALNVVSTWLQNRQGFLRNGVGLVYHGSYGTGKTMLVSLAGKELVKLGHDVFFTTFPGMVDMFTKGWGDAKERQRFERKIVESEILILDDIGKEFRTKTNLAESTFDHILRQRVIALRPTILTTNMNEEELREGYGAAILSLMMERSVVEEAVGDDWRESARQRTLTEVRNGWTRPIF